MTRREAIYCGKCGTANPAENQYCRRCGHRLDDDLLDEAEGQGGEQDRGPTVLEGIELRRFPLVDPATGEPISAPARPMPERPAVPPERRGSTVLWSLSLHVTAIVVAAALAVVVVVSVEQAWISALSQADTEELLREQWQLVQRSDFRDMSDDQRTAELARIMRAPDPETLIRSQLILHGGLLLGFLAAGFIAGRIRRPSRLMDVGLGALLTGAAISLCCCNPVVATLGFLVSLGGAWLGRRSGYSGD